MENKNRSAFATSPVYNSELLMQSGEEGLTKRELIAAMAMQGLLSNTAILTGDKHTISVEVLAESSLHYADALINLLAK